MNSDGEKAHSNLLHCTFASLEAFSLPHPTRRKMFRNPSGEEHSISVVLHCCSGSSLIKVSGEEEEIQMAIVYFAIFRFLHPF